MTREKVYSAVDSERSWQDRKWGAVEQHPHEVAGWLTLIRTHLEDAERAWAGSSNDYAALLEIRKIIALGVACAEQHGIVHRSPHQEMERMRT